MKLLGRVFAFANDKKICNFATHQSRFMERVEEMNECTRRIILENAEIKLPISILVNEDVIYNMYIRKYMLWNII